MSRPAYVYLAANAQRSLIADVTKDLDVAAQHQAEFHRRIVYTEQYPTAIAAHARVQDISWSGQQFCAQLVEEENPDWQDIIRPPVPAGGSSDEPGDSTGGVPARTVPPPNGPLSAAAAIAPDSA